MQRRITTKLKRLIFVVVIIKLAFFKVVFADDLVIMTGEWKPFVSTELKGYGFSAIIVSEAFSSVGIKPDFKFAPWPRCETAVKYGKSFGTFPYTRNKERIQFAYFSDVLANSRTVFFYNRQKISSFDYTGPDSLNTYVVGGIRGYFYLPALEKANVSIDLSENETDAFKKLLFKRVDLVAVNELVGWKIINTTFTDHRKQFATCNTAYSVNSLRLMVSKKHEDAKKLLALFNKGLHSIKSNGTYRKIIKRYKIPEPVGSFHNE